MAVVLGLLAAISYGSADFLGGLATKRNPAVRAALISQAVGFTVYLVALPLLPEGQLTVNAWLWGSPALPAIAFFGRAARIGQGHSGRVDPTFACVSPRCFRRRHLGDRHRTVLITLARPGEDTGAYPLLAARFVSISMFLSLVIGTRTSLRPAPGTSTVIAASGILDVTANLLQLFSTREGLLSVVAVLTSLYPGATVALARVVVKERLSVHQLVGIALALTGVALMAG